MNNNVFSRKMSIPANGRYDLVSSENFGAYLSAVGVGFAKRAIASTMKPTIEISQDDGNGTYTLKTLSVLKNTSITFKPGVEFDEETADGRMAKSTVTVDGNKLIHIQRIGEGVSKVIREFNGDEMTAVFSFDGVSSTRKYKKVG